MIKNPVNIALEAAIQYAAKEFKKNLKAQGHVLTMKLLNSIEGVVIDVSNIVFAYVEMESYGEIVDKGVKAKRVPYNPGSGAKKSKYITALISFFRRKGLDEKNARGAAFATAMKHKREGMPTRNSSIYSSTGKRTGFISDNIDTIRKKVEEIITRRLDDEFFKDFILELEKVQII